MNAPSQWLPYCGAGPTPGEWLERWNFDPVLLILVAALLAAGWRLAPARRTSHAAAALVFAIFFISPFCALGSALFSFRAIHHIALVLILAPLLVVSFALHEKRLPISLAALTAIQALVFWTWHAPSLYAAALSSDAAFWLMQITITASAAVWWAKLRQAPVPAAIGALLATMVQMGVLGALLTFAGRAFYAPHWLTTQPWGMSPLEDQQIAGLIMWAPASAFYLLAAAVLLYRSLQPVPAR